MTKFDQFARDVLKKVAESIEIKDGHYQSATERYRSLGEWFHREGSTIADDGPEVYPQGSFRLGLVIRPLNREGEYDLDLVCELRELHKDDGSQEDLKRRVGKEVIAYAAAQKAEVKVDEGRRCWTLVYPGDPSFHIDSLPAIPEDEEVKARIASAVRPEEGVGPQVAATAIAITDKTSAHYKAVTDDWQMSNPAGYATWFEGRMRAVAQPRLDELVRGRIYATVQDVPAYDWKTPLQMVVQVLKRHRDVMFDKRPDVAPISAIITTLAARAYDNETDVLDALSNVVDKMQGLVQRTKPRVPNPANPGEDFADKWDTAREGAFAEWMGQLRTDVSELRRGMESERLRKFLRLRLGIVVDDAWASRVCAPLAVQSVPAQPRTVNVHTSSAPGPWRDG